MSNDEKITFMSQDLAKIVYEKITDKFKFLFQSDWIGQGKYEYATVYFADKSDGTWYGLNIDRSGSEFTEWYYSFENWYRKTDYPVEVYKVDKVDFLTEQLQQSSNYRYLHEIVHHLMNDNADMLFAVYRNAYDKLMPNIDVDKTD